MRRGRREGKRGLQLLLVRVAPPCGWFGDVRPEAMPSSSPAKESVPTARGVRALPLDGPGEEGNAHGQNRHTHAPLSVRLFTSYHGGVCYCER